MVADLQLEAIVIKVHEQGASWCFVFERQNGFWLAGRELLGFDWLCDLA